MAVWDVRLLGGLRATHAATVITQFPSRPVALLLARLALEPQRRHSREELVDALWPDVDLDVGRNRLRQVLSTLRRLLEPADIPPSSVLLADRQTVALNADAITCDVQEFERLLKRGSIAQALERYPGDLLPGYADEWVEDERTRLAALCARARLSDGSRIARSPFEAHSTAAHRVETAHGISADANLPSYVSAFFGRDAERQTLLDALADHRLVTLTGLGGFGKTRLAVESARLASGFDIVAFVPLADCDKAELIVDCIRSALSMRASQDEGLAQLCAFLEHQDVLLVLDNFEQLVESGAGVVIDLLERLPRVRCLVTSRRAMAVPGEFVIAVPPLPVPSSTMNRAEMVANPSVALFIDRARGARGDFGLTEDNRPSLIELSRALEGLPLAIEIAASRIRSYSPSEMCAALAERFTLLTRQGPRGARYGRHASLQAAIEWSWNLLSAAEQRFFASLSVFRGGFTAEAVDAIFEMRDARASLESLVCDSLVRAEPEGTGMRFSMLETLREFARERLDRSEAVRLRARHRAYFLRLAEASGESLASIERELGNLKEALATAVQDGDAPRAVDLAIALRPHWEAHGTLPDDLCVIEQAMSECPPGERYLDAGLNLVAELTLTAGHAEKAAVYAQRALDAAGDDPARRARALVSVAHVNWERDERDRSVVATIDEALALAQKTMVADIEADALRIKASIVLRHGAKDADHATADALLERAEVLYRRLRQPCWAYRVMRSRAGCLAGLERYDEARQMLASCERYFAEFDLAADQIAAANIAGYIASLQERWREALDAGRRGVQLAWDHHAHLPLAMALCNLPYALVRIGDVEPAAQLTAFAAKFWQRSIGRLSSDDVATFKDVRKRIVKQAGAARTASLWTEGEALSLAEAVHLALYGRTASAIPEMTGG